MVDVGSRCEFKVYHNRYNRKTHRLEEVSVPSLAAGSSSDEHQENREYGLVVKHMFDKEDEHDKTVLTVNSPLVLRAFREAIETYPTVASDFRTPFDMESPFPMLVHHWDKLDTYRQETTDDAMRMHLNLLFEFMDSELGASRGALLAMLQKRQITFEMLWAIFVPGRLLYKNENGHPWLLRCQKSAYEDYTNIGPVCQVYAQFTDFNGEFVGDAFEEIWIHQKKKLAGGHPAKITDLNIYPLEFWNGDGVELERQLRSRGRRFLGLRGVNFKYYHGIAKYLKAPPYDYYGDRLSIAGYWLPFTEKGRVILDRSLAEEDLSSDTPEVEANPDGDPMLCPPYLYGYSPSRKEWCRYNVESLTEISWKTSPWDTLLLKDEQKRVLKALVESHIFPDNARDMTEQKGKGLVMLLHGTPGSGKTMTAECAAEAAHTILIMSSLGELNKDNHPSLFESRLKQLLHYATRWRGIVLLDEADVFLESREQTGGSETRNALVAVFLKHLEYFSGIIFLTTNRIRAFDMAMKSRIHLALSYSPPDHEARRQLWNQVLGEIPASEIDMDPDDDGEELWQEKLNGREIAYAVSTARTIARYEGQPLRLEHLHTVVGVRREFDASLEEAARKMTGLSMHRSDSILGDTKGDFKS